MNNVSLIGRVASDLKVVKTNEGKSILNFSLAVSKKYKKDEAFFLKCVSFGKQADVISTYVKKGDRLAVDGYLKNTEYETEKVKVYGNEIVVENFYFIQDRKKQGENIVNIQDNIEKLFGTNEFDEDCPF